MRLSWPSAARPIWSTRILTLQNGIDSVDLIQAHVGKTAVRGGVI
jgi:ketopantoate reductase